MALSSDLVESQAWSTELDRRLGASEAECASLQEAVGALQYQVEAKASEETPVLANFNPNPDPIWRRHHPG